MALEIFQGVMREGTSNANTRLTTEYVGLYTIQVMWLLIGLTGITFTLDGGGASSLSKEVWSNAFPNAVDNVLSDFRLQVNKLKIMTLDI